MRFLYFGSFGPYNTESYIAQSLRELDHVVDCVDRVEQGAGEITARLNREKYDVLLFSKVTSSFGVQLDMAKNNEVKTVCWLFDLYWDWRKNFKNLPMWKADYVFTTDGGHNEEWKALGVNHQLLRQGVLGQERLSLKPNYEYDVAFVGSLHYIYRDRLVSFLKSNYNFLHVTNKRGLHLNKELSRVKVVVGDSAPSPHYWSNRSYEVTGRGGFLIHSETEGYKEEFPHVPTFHRTDFKQMTGIIDHYLEDDREREELKQKQFEHTANFTYFNRCKELCKRILS